MATLYRKYRPVNFDQVVGQEHIDQSLRAALAKDVISHAYLFAGPRGIGKTSMARILAKAANCLNRQDGQPCLKCDICTEISRDQSLDIIEIDAASNRGIDEIRELREKLNYSPARSKYKVYIIDEVHMLTTPAFNALLKSLEEPPEHVIFILATTEFHKLPETIISRCQRYHFHRASHQKIRELISDIAKKEKIKIDGQVIELIAARSEGSFRDALTLLDALSSHPQPIDEEKARSILGIPPKELAENASCYLLEGRAQELHALINSSLKEGIDLGVVVRSVVDRLRLKLLSEEFDSQNQKEILLMEGLLAILARSRNSEDPTALIMAKLLQLSYSNQVKPLIPVAGDGQSVRDLQTKDQTKSDDNQAVDTLSAQKPNEEESFYGQFLEMIKNHNHALYAVLRSAHYEGCSDNKITIAVKFRFYCDRLNEMRNRKLIELTAGNLLGRQVILDCLVRSDLVSDKVKRERDLVQAVVDVFEIEES